MPFYRNLLAKEKLPADYTRALEQFIGLFSNLVIEQVSNTVIRVAAGANNGQVSLGIEGLWRWINAEVQATHPGGAAGSYDIVATTTANSFTPGIEEEEDHTNYNWALRIVPTGEIPSGGGIAATRKIGTLTWDGSKITIGSVTQLVGATTSLPPYSVHSGMLAPASVTAEKLSPASVGSTAIGLAVVTAEKLAASLGLTGSPTAPTPPEGDESTRLATTSFVGKAITALKTAIEALLALKAPLASPVLTGNPTAPTQAATDKSTKLATTAFAAAIPGTPIERGSLALNTNFQATTPGRPAFFVVHFTQTEAAGGRFLVKVGSAEPPTIIVIDEEPAGAGRRGIAVFMLPPGWFWRMEHSEGGANSIQRIIETPL